MLFELCPAAPAVADLSTLQVVWSAPNPNVYGLAVGPDDAIATSIVATNWQSSSAPNFEGPALQMSNEEGALQWAMGAEIGEEGSVLVSKDYIYLITRVKQMLYQITRDGVVRWQRQLPDLSGGSIVMNDLEVDDDENLYVYGQYEDTFEAGSLTAKDTSFPDGYLLSLTKDNEPRWLIPEASDDDLGTTSQMVLNGGLLYTIDDELRIWNTDDGSIEKAVELDLAPLDEDVTHIVLDQDGSLLTTYQIGSATADRLLDSNFVLTTPHGQVPANDVPTTNFLVRYTSDLEEVWRTHLGDSKTWVKDLAVMPNGEIVVLVSQLDSAAGFLDVEPRLSHLLRYSSTGTFMGSIQGEANMGIDWIDVQPLSGLLVVALHTEGAPLTFPDADPAKNWGMVGTLPAFPVP